MRSGRRTTSSQFLRRRRYSRSPHAGRRGGKQQSPRPRYTGGLTPGPRPGVFPCRGLAPEMRSTAQTAFGGLPVKRWMPSTVLATVATAFVVAACSSDTNAPKAPVAGPPLGFFTSNPHIHLMLPLSQLRPTLAPDRAPTVDNGIYYHG